MMRDINFKYSRNELPPGDEASNLAHNVHVYPEEYVLSGEEVFYRFNAGIINNYLNQLSPANLTILLGNPNFMTPEESEAAAAAAAQSAETPASSGEETVTANTEEIAPTASFLQSKLKVRVHKMGQEIPDKARLQYQLLTESNFLYKITYSQSPLTQEFLDMITQVNSESYASLKLPEENQYVPKDLNLLQVKCKGNDRNCEERFEDDALNFPDKLLDDEYLTIWYQLDRSYLTPSIYCSILIQTPYIYQSHENFITAYVMDELTSIALNQEMYSMAAAGNDVSIDLNSIEIYAFSDTFQNVLNVILTEFKRHKYSEAEFTLAKEAVLSTLYAQVTQDTYKVLSSRARYLLQEYTFAPEELFLAMEKYSYKDFQAKAPKLLEEMHIEVLFTGNLLEDQAKNYARQIKETFDYTGIYLEEIPENEALNLAGKNLIWREMSKQPNAVEDGILNIYQSGPITPKTFAYLKISEYLMENEAYTYLRTEKNLGYIAFLYSDVMSNVLNFNILVQGSTEDANGMDREIEIFLGKMLEKLDDLSEEDFQSIKDSLSDNLEAPDMSLKEKGERFTARMIDRTHAFDLRSTVRQELPEITKEEYVKYFNSLVRTPAKLSIQILKYNENKEVPSESLSEDELICKVKADFIESKSEFESFVRYPLKINF